MFWGLNIPHLLRLEGGIKDEGTGKSMAEWNPAAIELFQLTLAEEKGGFQNIPHPLTHSSFSTEITPLLLLLHTRLSAFVSFSIFLYPEVACHFLFMKLCLMFFPPENLFENVKPCTFFVFLKNL